MKIRQIALIAFFFFLQTLFCDLSKGQPYQNRKYPQKEEKLFDHRGLGIMFRYNPLIEDIEHTPADIGTWKLRNLIRFRISFKSPVYYKASWGKKNSYSYSTPTDSVYKLDFGNGVTVQIYESNKKFYEIAFAEDFKQYRKNGESFPESKWDTIARPILDSAWTMQGLSGMYSSGSFLNGKKWKGLRCKSDTRGYSDSEPYSYSDECWFSLLVHPIPGNRNLVVFYQKWPPSTDESKANPQSLDEQDFYDLVASIKFVKDRK